MIVKELPPAVLTVAGTDPSGGAGVPLDLRVFRELGVDGFSAVTAVVAQVPGKVRGVHPVPGDLVKSQIDLLMPQRPVAAAKVGMLGTRANVRAAAAALAKARAAGQIGAGLVVDPVLLASAGGRLLERDALDALKADLLPLADLVTPNWDEMGALLGTDLPLERAAGEAAAAALGTHLRSAVLLKGGHFGGETSDDYFWEGGAGRWLGSPRIPGADVHGTGCALSAAAAARLALGDEMGEAVAAAKEFVRRAIAGRVRWWQAEVLGV